MINTYDYTFYTLIVEGKYLFEIPNYQRHYVWTEKEIKLFLNDGYFCMGKYLGRDEKFEHYAGQMIFRKLREEKDGRSVLEIIDGQQRLTTFMLLIMAVMEQLGMEKSGSQEIEELRKKYLLSCSGIHTCECEKKLKLSQRDSSFWESMFAGTVPRKEDGMLESQLCLLKAREIIIGYLEKITKEMNSAERESTLMKFVDALANSFRIVMLMSEKGGQEFALFQIVNDRGVPLTAGELLKARTIELLTSQKKEERRDRIIREAEEIWSDILQDDGKTTERFLVWHYTAVLGKKTKSIEKISLREQYECDIFQCLNQREISMDAQEEMLDKLKQLHLNVRMCRRLEKGEFPVKCNNENINLLFSILICNMKNIFVIPIYLHIFECYTEKKAMSIIELLTPMLAKTYFQAKRLGRAADESVRKCYLEIWNKIGEEKVSMEAIKEILEKLLKKGKHEEEFNRKIEQDIFERNTGNFEAKFLLLMIELQYLKEGEKSRADFGDDSVKIVFDKLSIEHILHKSISADEVSGDQYASIHKIGNLTLLGEKINSREDDRSFEEKREDYLLSPYVITRKVGELKVWKYKEFKERQEELTQVLKRAFAL